MATPIITREEYKTYASINSGNSDDQIDALLNPVSLTIENYLGYKFLADAEITQRILLRDYQTEYLITNVGAELTGVTLKALNPTASSISSYPNEIVLTEDDWFFESDIGMLTILASVPSNYQAVISYTITKEISDEIKLAALMLLDYWRDSKNFKTSVTQQGQSVSKVPVGNLPSHIEAIINPIRRI